MCIYGYLDAREAEIIFASPKIHKSILDGVTPCLVDMQRIMDDLGFRFLFRIIANDDFRDKVLFPILKASNGVADTNELFIRSYQMTQMFEKRSVSPGKPVGSVASEMQTPKEAEDTYSEMKIGKVAQLVLRPILESGRVSEDEIEQLQSKKYSNDVLNLNFPLLVNADAEYDKTRYYSEPLLINGAEYVMCSQWIERPENNDRPYLMRWIRAHQ